MSHAGDSSSVFDQAIAEHLMVINSLREQQPLLQHINHAHFLPDGMASIVRQSRMNSRSQ
jgi:hypothetical protein